MIDEECSLIASKQQRFSPQQADAIQKGVNMLAEKDTFRKFTSVWAARCLELCKGTAFSGCARIIAPFIAA